MGFDLKTGDQTIGLIGVPDAKKKESHVRWIPPNILFCTRCGERCEMELPALMTAVETVLLSFNKKHKKCRLRKSRGLACTYCFEFGHPHSKCHKLEYNGDPMAWRQGPDTGASSITLWEQLFLGYVSAVARVPRDPGDFGRCYRLLKAFPMWRNRIAEMNDVPGWTGLVCAWSDLEKLYEEELPSGACPKLYELMRTILGESTRD